MKKMNHAEYQKNVKSKSDAELLYIIKDCQESLVANPDTINASYYADEICYCGMELKKRKDELKKALGIK